MKSVSSRASARRAVAAVALMAGAISSSCGGGHAPAPVANYPPELLNRLSPHPPVSRPGAATASAGANPTPPTTPSRPADDPAELVRRDIPETVIAGREVFFGLDVVDEEMDAVRISLASHPEGAELDTRTMTVRWRVPASMTGPQTFTVQTDETLPDGSTNTQRHDLRISVAATAPVAGAPAVVPPLVGQLVTITARDYLAAAARDWPITRVLELTRDAALDALPAADRSNVRIRSGADLFRDLLTGYAQLHNNPRLDPASPQFDRRFEASHWRLVAVRPRMNKAVQELRLAYQATDVPEPVFTMFRVRLFRGAAPPSPDVARANNEHFTRLVHAAFWNGAQLRPGIREGRAAQVSAAVATLVRSVMTFRDAQNPLLRMGLVAIPQEARMGGGSEFDAQGHYVAGNAWAFSVGNLVVADAPPTPPVPAATHAPAGAHAPARPARGAQTAAAQPTTAHPAATATAPTRAIFVRNVPISSFTFDIGPNAAGTAFTSVCPPRYRVGGDGHEAGLETLCAPDGTVRIRERNAQNAWVATRRDAANEHREVVTHEMVERVPLRDVRRRNFEENGMTCVQCHIRNFDDGVLSETQVGDPRVQQPITAARAIERVRMQILPLGTLPRSPWLIQQETNQLCDMGRDIQNYLHVNAGLTCPDGY